ncbi:hypothetical protein [Candidatus Poriferisocius sp.]|uniref:hypothetical protein n=1 Tax=Candidatus Poriferisocius sp. TaxID=3101276 RepID=UPI003B011BDB
MEGEAAPRKADRRVLVCDGVRAVFARRTDGLWGLANEAELAVLEGLGGPSEPISRLRGMGAALEAGVAGPGDIAELGRCLRRVAASTEVFEARVPPHLAAAVTVACAWWDHYAAAEWLGWAVSARLESNLSAEAGVGPGWLGWEINAGLRPRRAWWNGCGWLAGLGEGFWERLACHRDEAVRLSAEASDPDTSPARLKEMAKWTLWEVADLVCSHPRTPAGALKHLCRFHTQHRPVYRTAQNASADPAVLRWLFRGRYRGNSGLVGDRVLWLLAVNPNTPRDVLGRLSRSKDSGVLSWVACHPNAGRRTLERLAGHPQWIVRRPIAWNPSAPDRLIAWLAADRHRGVRAVVAERRGLPGDVLEQLAADRSLVVRAAAAANLQLCEHMVRRLAEDPHPRVRASIARRADAPEDVLAALTEDADPAVRKALGNNPSASPEAVACLAEDSDLGVRRAVCARPEVPEDTIGRFACSEDDWLRWGAAANTSTPPDVLEALVGDSDSQVKDAAARNPNIDEAVLERLAAHRDKYIRHSVVENPSVPDRLLEQLCEDECAVVFSAAAYTLRERRAQNAARERAEPLVPVA